MTKIAEYNIKISGKGPYGDDGSDAVESQVNAAMKKLQAAGHTDLRASLFIGYSIPINDEETDTKEDATDTTTPVPAETTTPVAAAASDTPAAGSTANATETPTTMDATPATNDTPTPPAAA